MKEMKEIQISLKRRFWWVHKAYKFFGFRSVVNKPMMVYGKKYISIGDGVMIRDGARIEAVSQWGGQMFEPNLVIGNNTTFEQNLHLTFASHLEIGSNCVFVSNVMITDISHNNSDINSSVMEQGITVKKTTIGDGCFVGKNACIMPGVRLGQGVIVGANAVVTKDVPDYCVVAGIPAKVIKTRGKNEANRLD